MSDIPIHSPNPSPDTALNPRNIWLRGLWMLLMALAFHIASMLLCLVALVQLVLVLLRLGTNQPLQDLACSLGEYLRQIAAFVGFAVEEVPFPFDDWPSRPPPSAPDSGPPG